MPCPTRIAIFIAWGVLLVGCAKEYNEPQLADRAAYNRWLVSSYQQDMVKAAIITQSTLYPYHFVQRTAKLTEVGERDLRVLAKYFKENPGTLNVHQGDAEAPLYDARLHTIRHFLASNGVDDTRMHFEDGLPGGTGTTASRAVTILESDAKPLQSETGSSPATSPSNPPSPKAP